jgi:hypothetical protein
MTTCTSPLAVATAMISLYLGKIKPTFRKLRVKSVKTGDEIILCINDLARLTEVRETEERVLGCFTVSGIAANGVPSDGNDKISVKNEKA